MISRRKKLTEDTFIQKYFAPLSEGFANAHKLRDDAAYLSPKSGEKLVVTADTLIEGVHFMFDGSKSSAASAAHKALACSVSDLAAKAAKPLCYTLSLTLPKNAFEGWIDGLVAALSNAQNEWGLSLVGGDTTRHDGPLILTITAVGTLPSEIERTRANASPNEILFVSGTIGDARVGLGLVRDEANFLFAARSLSDPDLKRLIDRTERPTPRIELIDALRAYASATIDISDGLVRDLTRLCIASNVGAEVNVAKIPISEPVRSILQAGRINIATLLTGGDDYEIIATVPEKHAAVFQNDAQSAGCNVTPIGQLTSTKNVRFTDAAGNPLKMARSGWDHFDE